MKRAYGVARLAAERFDVLIVGGGATGLGATVDAASRGYRTGLVEAEDFAKATSSRSTKLVHGGVRYLQQGNVGLVREALHERGALLRNAPHLVRDLAFVVPTYAWRDLPYYAAGLKAYDLLAVGSGFAASRAVSAQGAARHFPALRSEGLRGAIVYHDGQFDDARLAVTLARTAVDLGAAVANRIRAHGFLYEGGRVAGVEAIDLESGARFPIRARSVINATGIFADALRSIDRRDATPMLTLSRGVHVVVPSGAFGDPGSALLVPRTNDGRVLFAIPWNGSIVLGTTDVPASAPELDPVPSAAEVSYILSTVNRYLAQPLENGAITAVFAGLRPLVDRNAATTAKLSREHLIEIAPSGLVTIAGGKWTTYRKMAEDVVSAAAASAGLREARSRTAKLALRGASGAAANGDPLRVYGSDAQAILTLAREDAALARRLHAKLPYTGAEVVYAARHEMARTVDDVLARRTRALFLDAAAARASAPAVAEILARELGRDRMWVAEQLAAFESIVNRSVPQGA